MTPRRRVTPLVVGFVAAVQFSACDDSTSRAPSEPAAEEAVPAHLLEIADPDIIDRIFGMFAPGEDRANAFVHYSQIRIRALTGDRNGAVVDAFEFLEWTLRILARGRIDPPGAVEPAEAVADLFARIFAELGVDGPPFSAATLDQDFAIGLIGPAGGRVTVPSSHAAIAFDPGVLTGPTWVAVTGLPGPSAPGACPFGFQVDVSCYPLFYDYSIFPQSNLAGVPRIGQCVVEQGPLAPPSEAVETRLRLASESHSQPGTLVFWPLTEAPITVDCADLEQPAVAAWQGAVFRAIGPLAALFSVTPAYANPGRLGASISSFSPFAPADPEMAPVPEPEPEPDPDPEPEPDPDPDLPPDPPTMGTIDGVVLSPNEQGVPGVTVLLQEIDGLYTDSAITGSNGGFGFEGIPIAPDGSDYRVSVEERFGGDSEVVTLTESDPEDFVTLVVESVAVEQSFKSARPGPVLLPHGGP